MRKKFSDEAKEKDCCILSLGHSVRRLEEKCCQAEKEVELRDDVIKQMRKDLKKLEASHWQFQQDRLELVSYVNLLYKWFKAVLFLERDENGLIIPDGLALDKLSDFTFYLCFQQSVLI